MATYAELLAAATAEGNYKQGRAGSAPALALAGGIAQGMKPKTTEERMAEATKLLQLKSAIMELEQKKRDQEENDAVLTGAGMKVPSTDMSKIIRMSALDLLNYSENKPAKGIKTDAGKMATMLDQATGGEGDRTFKVEGGAEKFDPSLYRVEPSGTVGSMKWKLGEKPKVSKDGTGGSGNPAVEAKRRWDLAVDMAKSYERNVVYKDNPDILNKILNEATYVPDKANIIRFWNEAGAILTGNTELTVKDVAATQELRSNKETQFTAKSLKTGKKTVFNIKAKDMAEFKKLYPNAEKVVPGE